MIIWHLCFFFLICIFPLLKLPLIFWLIGSADKLILLISVFIDSSLNCFTSFDPLEKRVSMLNSVLLSGLVLFAPQKSGSISIVSPAPWYIVQLLKQQQLPQCLKSQILIMRTSLIFVTYLISLKTYSSMIKTT